MPFSSEVAVRFFTVLSAIEEDILKSTLLRRVISHIVIVTGASIFSGSTDPVIFCVIVLEPQPPSVSVITNVFGVICIASSVLECMISL